MALTDVDAGRLADNVFDVVGPDANLVLNGGMRVAQRRTSLTVAHDGVNDGYCVDRFRYLAANLDEFDGTLSQSSTTPPAGFTNSLLLTTGTAETTVDANELLYLTYRIEAHDCQRLAYGTANAKETRLSFWVRSSITGTFGLCLYREDASRNITLTYTVNSANTWEKKIISVPADTTGVINDDNGNGLEIDFILCAGTDWTSTDSSSWGAYATTGFAYGHVQNGVITTASATWEITGVQFEEGTEATPFQVKSYGDELQRCQRYCMVYEGDGAANGFAAFATGYTSTASAGSVVFTMPAPLRAIPTLTNEGTIYVSGSGFNVALTSWTNVYATRTGSILAAFTSSAVFTTYNPCFLYTGNAATDKIIINAEL